MLKFEREEYEAIASLRNRPEWGVFIKCVEQTLMAQRQANDAQLDERILRQGQGQCQILAAIVKGDTDALEVIKKYRLNAVPAQGRRP